MVLVVLVVLNAYGAGGADGASGAGASPSLQSTSKLYEYRDAFALLYVLYNVLVYCIFVFFFVFLFQFICLSVVSVSHSACRFS